MAVAVGAAVGSDCLRDPGSEVDALFVGSDAEKVAMLLSLAREPDPEAGLRCKCAEKRVVHLFLNENNY